MFKCHCITLKYFWYFVNNISFFWLVFFVLFCEQITIINILKVKYTLSLKFIFTIFDIISRSVCISYFIFLFFVNIHVKNIFVWCFFIYLDFNLFKLFFCFLSVLLEGQTRGTNFLFQIVYFTISCCCYLNIFCFNLYTHYAYMFM